MIKDQEYIKEFKKNMEEIDENANVAYNHLLSNISIMGLSDDYRNLPKITITYNNKIFEMLRELNGSGLLIKESLIGTSTELYLTAIANKGLSYLEMACDIGNQVIDNGLGYDLKRVIARALYRAKYKLNSLEQVIICPKEEVDIVKKLVDTYIEVDESLYSFNLRENAIDVLCETMLNNPSNWELLNYILIEIYEEFKCLKIEDRFKDLISRLETIIDGHISYEISDNTLIIGDISYNKQKDNAEKVKVLQYTKKE